MQATGTTRLPVAEQQILWQAVAILERESFIAQVSELTGEPVSHLSGRLPRPFTRRFNLAVQRALHKALDLALYSLDPRLPEPGITTFKIVSGLTGGVSGFFGLTALSVELPFTTTLMLRSIAGIARQQGEDFTDPLSRLACLEVLPSARDIATPAALQRKQATTRSAHFWRIPLVTRPRRSRNGVSRKVRPRPS